MQYYLLPITCLTNLSIYYSRFYRKSVWSHLAQLMRQNPNLQELTVCDPSYTTASVFWSSPEFEESFDQEGENGSKGYPGILEGLHVAAVVGHLRVAGQLCLLHEQCWRLPKHGAYRAGIDQ